jgi:hypothetical protein
MAYQTGTATSPENLLDTMRLFLAANGWGISFWGTDPQDSGKWLSVVSPSGSYFNFLAMNSSALIYVRGATGYSANNNRNSQPGQSPGWTRSNGLSGPYTSYHLFVGSTYCHVVVEVVTNRFVHFHAGVLEKAGNYNGGEYQTGTDWQYGSTNWQHLPDSEYNTMPFNAYSYLPPSSHEYYRMDADGAVNNWYHNNATVGVSDASLRVVGCIRGYSMTHRLFGRSPNHITGQSILLPSIICGPRPAGGSAIYGSVKDLRPINIANLTPKQVLNIGTDEWLVFPIIRKGWTSQYEPCSGNYAFAYKKVT